MKQSIIAYYKVCNVLGVGPVGIQQSFPDVPGATLVIVPDQAFDYKELIKLAKAFGKDQKYETYVYKDLYKQYSSVELSGKPIGKGYRSLYIPEKYNVVSNMVANQKAMASARHIPSVLEAITHWFVLREIGKSLNFDSTYIRHFDLPEKTLGDFSYVPDSFVYNDGQPRLVGSLVDDDSDARVSVVKLDSRPLPSEPLASSLTDLQENTRALNQLNETIKKVFKV